LQVSPETLVAPEQLMYPFAGGVSFGHCILTHSAIAGAHPVAVHSDQIGAMALLSMVKDEGPLDASAARCPDKQLTWHLWPML
jgi:hypothetical protein